MKDGRIAVTEENGEVFQHFGHTRYFAVYDIKDGAVSGKEIIDAEGSGHSALAGFLAEAGVGLLICGGIGGGAINALADAGIEVVYGADGSTDEAVKNFLAGNLQSAVGAACDHHNHGEVHGECRGCGHGKGTCN